MLTLLTLLWASVAGADDDAYRTCCGADNACPSTIAVVGPGSYPDGDGVLGLWLLTCEDGASFYPHARRSLATTAPGTVATPLDAASLSCFASSCELPADLCFSRAADGLVTANQCASGRPASSAQLAAPPSIGDDVWAASPAQSLTTVARVSPLQTTPAPMSRPGEQGEVWGATAPAASKPSPAPQWTPPSTTASSTGLSPWTSEPLTDTTLVASTAAVQVDYKPAAPAHRPQVSASLDLSMPVAPSDPCVPAMNRRQASNDQVDLGDEASIRGDEVEALGHYRAALLVNECNPHAWAAIGTILLDHGQTEDARDAFRYTTSIDSTHLRGWTKLGLAYEQLGNTGSAIDALHRAIELRPGYLPAENALRRAVRAH